MKIYTHTFSPFAVNTYIVDGGKGECIVIDCSCYTQEEFNTLTHTITSLQLKPIALLNTHCHFDHLFGSMRFLKHYGLCYKCHADDIHNAEMAFSDSMIFDLYIDRPPITKDYINENDTIYFGYSSLKILHVPGHSPGSLAFYNQPENIVFSGDSLFYESIGRTDLYKGNYQQLISSIQNKLFTLPAITKVLPGHGISTTIEHETINNPYFKH